MNLQLAIIQNNLSNIYYILKKFIKVVKFAQLSLSKLEPFIYG